MEEIGIEAIRRGCRCGRDVVKRTPVVPSVTLSEMLGSEMLGGNVVLKAENLQRTGAFKIRGAMNKLASLGRRRHARRDRRQRRQPRPGDGVRRPHLRRAVRDLRARRARRSPRSRRAAAYGAACVEAGTTLDEAVAAARDRADETGMAFCHPFDDPAVVAGQGTLGLELVDDVADLAVRDRARSAAAGWRPASRSRSRRCAPTSG